MLLVLFAVSMFLSAALLFLVEPMLAKMMLPLLGGTPAVWNTCLVFFQAMLLAGYLYAHAAMKWLGQKTQIVVQSTLVLIPLLLVGMLPVHLPVHWLPPQSFPAGWILSMLLVAIGLPFFALSSNTPIMQRWFACSGTKGADDPYFLYAASNAGSLGGLLAYPLLFEPLLPLSTQSRLWSSGYMLFVVITAACALCVWRSCPSITSNEPDSAESSPSLSKWRERLHWVALAFVPSSLMLGVTTKLTTDVPAFPLFWVLPLAVYLASFVFVFARRPPISHEFLTRRLPFLILASLVPTVAQVKFPFAVLLALYLATLFGIAMVCHGELARHRPELRRLTEFYLLISFGGVLGGIFNSLLAPVMFHSTLEFPLVLIFAALLRPAVDLKPLTVDAAVRARRNDWFLPMALGACMVIVIQILNHMGVRPGRSLNIVIFGYSMVWCLSFAKRRLRFVGGVAALFLASSFYTGPFGHILNTERSFFGVDRVTDSPNGKFRYLFHGGTIHGVQSLDPALSRKPLSYYTKSGPAGDIFRIQQARMPHGAWAIVGLGAGTMACYMQPGHTLTYYEIDSLVARIAENKRYFTFLNQCAPQTKVVLGDARQRLHDAPDAHYELIVVDAFSGDSIPMHLLTREALALYLSKLAPGGVIAFHISNLYLRLAPTLGDLAQDAHLACLIRNDTNVPQSQIDAGKFPSVWLVMARESADLAGLNAGQNSPSRWVPVHGRPGARIWTDDYSNLLTAINWN